MEDNVFQSMIVLIKDQFRSEFQEELADTTLISLIKDEIKHRKIEFLKSNLAKLKLSCEQLEEISTVLLENMNQHQFPHTSEDGFILKRRGRKATLTAKEREERRKAYAKRYYKERREKEVATKAPNEKLTHKSYKTTPEQRAYQKRYYAKKKSDHVTDDGMLVSKKKRGRPAKKDRQQELPPSAPFIVTKLRKAPTNKDKAI